MKIDKNKYNFGSIWDELPSKREKTGQKIPESQSEAIELVNAAQSSMDKSTLKAWDSHNDMMKKSAELRQIQARKKAIEQRYQQDRDEQRELMAKIALENAQRRERFKK